MQVAISGTYYQGQVQLHELPPAYTIHNEPSNVMVVFVESASTKKKKTATLFGIAKSDTDIDDEMIEKDLSELSKQYESTLLRQWDDL